MAAGNATNNTTTGINGFTGTAFTGTAVTQYNLIAGGATTSTLVNIAPSSTSGVPVISQGASANPIFGTAVVAGGGTGLTSATAYAVLCGGTSSTGPFQSIASVGNAGEVLTSNGAGSLPTFQTAGAGAWTLISTATAAASATINFTGLSSTYHAYAVIISNVIPATDTQTLFMRTSTDGGASYDAGASDYGWAMTHLDTTAVNFRGDTADSEIELTGTDQGNAAGEHGALIVYIINPSAVQNCKIFYQNLFFTNATSLRSGYGSGYRAATADVDAIRFLYASGNISVGTFKLYGISA